MAKRTKWRGDGCGFIIISCVVTCFFLIVNSILVMSFYSWYVEIGPAIIKNERFAQALLFVTPVLMVFVEWWLIDFLVDRLTRDVDSSTENRADRKA